MNHEPRIIVIGGVPGVGKTSLSGSLGRELGINIVMSGDYLREFLRAYDPEIEEEIMRYSVYDSWKPFGGMNRENVVSGFVAQGKIIWRGIDAIIERGEQNGEDMIIETLYFLPEFLNLKKRQHLKSLYLYISDMKIHSDRLNERESFTHSRAPGSRLVEHLEEYRYIMEYSLEKSKSSGLPSIDNLDYNHTRNIMRKTLGL